MDLRNEAREDAELHIEGLDELDNRIIEIIKDNARLTYSEIGAKAGVSRITVKIKNGGT